MTYSLERFLWDARVGAITYLAVLAWAIYQESIWVAVFTAFWLGVSVARIIFTQRAGSLRQSHISVGTGDDLRVRHPPIQSSAVDGLDRPRSRSEQSTIAGTIADSSFNSPSRKPSGRAADNDAIIQRINGIPVTGTDAGNDPRNPNAR